MLVTVYITNHNYARFIRQSIESVLAQTLRDYELIIIDDGSSDNSTDIIDEYCGLPGISVIYQENRGLNVTNNIAMRKARGKYLMRLDADDFLEPSALEVMVRKMESDTEIGLVFSNYYFVDKKGNVFGEVIRHDFDRDVTLYDQPAHGACTLIRLDFLRDVGGYDEAFICQDGYDLWLKFIAHYRVSNVNESLFNYRRHDRNLTLNEDKILRTRRLIKESYIEKHQLRTPATVAIIHVTNRMFGGCNWPLYEINGTSVLHKLVDTVAACSRVQFVAIATEEDDILDHLTSFEKDYPKLFTVPLLDGPLSASPSALTLNTYVLDRLSMKGVAAEALMTISLNYPYLTTDVIDAAVNTLVIFGADSVVSVQLDSSIFFRHSGHGMTPVVDESKTTKLEGEALYRNAGGIIVSRIDGFVKEQKMLNGKVSHIVVDEKTAFAVDTEFDFLVFNKLCLVGIEELSEN